MPRASSRFVLCLRVRLSIEIDLRKSVCNRADPFAEVGRRGTVATTPQPCANVACTPSQAVSRLLHLAVLWSIGMLCQAHIRRIARATVLLGLLSSVAGCSTWFSSDFQDPRVRLADIEIVKARLLEQQFLLRFRIDNPNDQSLPVRGLLYKVRLNDVELASGEASGWATVPANGYEYYEVPVYTNLWQHMKYIVRLLEKPDRPIAYRLDGELKTGLMLGRRVHISTNGEIIPGDFIPE